MSKLAKTAEGEKNFFGRYKQQVAKEWHMLLKLYE
jgi:hypothetical protein